MIPKTYSWIVIFPWIGGWFVFCYAVTSVIFFFTMNWITYLNVVLTLFKVDPAKGQTPRDPYAIEKAKPADLLTMA